MLCKILAQDFTHLYGIRSYADVPGRTRGARENNGEKMGGAGAAHSTP